MAPGSLFGYWSARPRVDKVSKLTLFDRKLRSENELTTVAALVAHKFGSFCLRMTAAARLASSCDGGMGHRDYQGCELVCVAQVKG